MREPAHNCAKGVGRSALGQSRPSQRFERQIKIKTAATIQKTMSPSIIKIQQQTVLLALCACCFVTAAAQEVSKSQLSSFRVDPTPLGTALPVIELYRNTETQDFQGTLVEEALHFNLGVKITPIAGLNLQADAWRQEIADAPAVTLNTGAPAMLPGLNLKDSVIKDFSIHSLLMGSQLKRNGFDLDASYIWDTNRFGQFTLSTKATYVQDFENRASLLELLNSESTALEDRVMSPELQSSLMLTWQLGNHTASAITNYFDSFKDLSELDLDEINALVDDITTIDLQYGYSVETSSNNRAIISFGVRNIFDEKTAQILNSSARILDQNGRIAYGSIKYQF